MKFKSFMTMFLVCVFMVPQIAYAVKGGGGSSGFNMPGGAWWQRQQTVKELNLSNSQQKKIGEVTLSHRKEMIRLRSELQLTEVDLDPLLSAKKLDEKAIQANIDAIENIRTKISRSRMNMFLSIRKILTRDQYLKLKELKDQRRRGGKGIRMQGRGSAKRHMRGPQEPFAAQR